MKMKKRIYVNFCTLLLWLVCKGDSYIFSCTLLLWLVCKGDSYIFFCTLLLWLVCKDDPYIFFCTLLLWLVCKGDSYIFFSMTFKIRSLINILFWAYNVMINKITRSLMGILSKTKRCKI